MRLSSAVLLLFALVFPAFAENDPRIREGIALHDAGKYDEAIARYKAVLADDPSNVLAVYELGLSHQAKGDAKECVAVLEPFLLKAGRYLAPMLTTYGTCLDLSGQSEKAVSAYRQALKLTPDDPSLQFNTAVTLVGREEYAEARELLKKAAVTRPAHLTTRYLLAKVFEAENFRVPALLEYLRYLTLDSSSERAKDAASRAMALLNLGVEKTGPKSITLTVDPNSRKEEGDFSAFEMMLALAGGSRHLPENRRKSEFDLVREQVSLAMTMLGEVAGDLPASYTTSQHMPFIHALHEKGLLDPFAARALSSLNLKGADKWSKKNAKKLAEYDAFIAAGAR
jgi:thioredoxin-like negative regulator of GroEL